MLYSELKTKEVINIRDCRCLGRVTNLEVDECSGCICKIIVSECGRLFCMFKCDVETVIPFKDIKQIGPDIILVDIRC
ncbi:MAG: YlmC/YmxH family sporulation protein [Lachnospiraceae bacterium]|nr:YlmC/YmxH family sporulation protein [Lachnospiraceae bacterium]